MNPIFFEGDYNSYYYESRFSEELIKFKPEIVYVYTNVDNINYPINISDNESDLTKKIELYLNNVQDCIDAISLNTQATVVINNLEYFDYRINGNIESTVAGGGCRFINELNVQLSRKVSKNSRVVINDISYLSAKIGLDNWRDSQSYFAFKQPFTQRAIVEIARSFCAIVSAYVGKGKKCLVLDLDNTLWGGIIGDDGVANLKIGQETATGESYSLFQTLIKPLIERGIAFAVCSKNTELIALEGLNDERMVLKEKDFHIKKINWDAKSSNIVSIQKTLNIGLDSLVFIDDSSFERSEVGFQLPDVYIPEIESDALSYINAISSEYVFETLALSKEDLERSASFNSMVEFESRSVANLDDYLISLNMSATFSKLADDNKTRVHQLINKTNQFNLNGTRMSMAEVEEISTIGYLRAASLCDNNSNYGLISVFWGDIDKTVLKLSNWVMSCRVFNRKLENHMLRHICEELLAMGIDKIEAKYTRTAKNSPVEGLLDRLGFELKSTVGDEKYYFLDVNEFINIEHDLKLKEIFK